VNCGNAPLRVGLPYSVTCTVSGGASPYTWIISSGALPDGLGIAQQSPTTAQISGTPTNAANYTWRVQATDFNAVQGVQDFTTIPVWPQLTTMYVAIDGGGAAASIDPDPVGPCAPVEAICISAGTGTVTIRNLTLNSGITVSSAGFVRVEHVTVSGAGIGYNAKSGSHSLIDVKIEGATAFGVAVNGAGVKLSINNSVMSRAPYGLVVFNGGLAQVDNCLLNLNTVAGLSTSGANPTGGSSRISNSTITDNAIGLDTTGTGASLISFTANHIFGNPPMGTRPCRPPKGK
jgi:large repetitive protein